MFAVDDHLYFRSGDRPGPSVGNDVFIGRGDFDRVRQNFVLW